MVTIRVFEEQEVSCVPEVGMAIIKKHPNRLVMELLLKRIHGRRIWTNGC